MRITHLLLCSVGCFSAAAQRDAMVHYNLLLNQASVHAAKGESRAAFTEYDSAFAHVPWGLWQRTEAASMALTQGDTTHALNYLEDIYRRGGEPLIAYSPELKGLLANGFMEPELGRLLKASHEWAEQADSVWIKALLEMETLDQQGGRSDERVYLVNDSLNLDRLIEMTESRGFPYPSITGASYSTVSWLLWHHRGMIPSSPRLRYFISLAEAEIQKGSIEPDLLCGLQDFEDVQAGRPMHYGTLVYYYHERGHIKLVDRAELNRNRASVGLVPIEDFALQLGIDLDAVTRP
jgi:hypothetical protein